MRMAFCFLIVLAGGCASRDPPAPARPFEPAGNRDGYTYYRVVLGAGRADYPDDREQAEQSRRQQIRMLLRQNGCPNPEFEVVDCRFVARCDSIIGARLWNIHYTIRVPIQPSRSDRPF